METRAQSSISTIHNLTIAANERSYLNRVQADREVTDKTQDYQGFVVGYDAISGKYILSAGGNHKTASPVQNKTLAIGQEALLRTAAGGSINWI